MSNLEDLMSDDSYDSSEYDSSETSEYESSESSEYESSESSESEVDMPAGYDSDEYNRYYAANKNHAVRKSFKIGNEHFQDIQLTKLVNSSAPEDENKLKAVVMQIMKDDNTKAFGYLLFRGYKMEPLNDKGQNTVHLLFYKECKHIIERQNLKNLSKKSPVFGSSPKEAAVPYMGFMSGLFFADEHKELFTHSHLLSQLVSAWLVKRDLDIKPTDCYGLNYMHIAGLVGEKYLVKKCLKNGMDVNARFNHPEILYKNYTPLHFGVLNPLRDTANIVDVLLKHGADVEARDALGRTPLHLACRLYHPPCDFQIFNENVKKNLKVEDLARRIVQKPKDFYTKNAGLVDLLLKKNSDINAKDEAGNTPLLSIFPEKYNDELSRFRDDWHDFGVPIKETTMKFAILVNAGADVTAKNGNGDTILHLIARNLKLWRNSSNYMEIQFDDSYHFEMMRKVLESCSQLNVNVRNKLGETPIQLALECMSFDIVKLLCDSGADLSLLTFKDNLFLYPDITPNFQAVRNLVSIAKLFEDNGFRFIDEVHLKVLQFLVHFTSQCQCVEKDYRHYALIFGSKVHICSVLNRLSTIAVKDSDDDEDGPFDDIGIYLDLIKSCKAYIDEGIQEMMENITKFERPEHDRSAVSRINKELTLMKSTILENKISVHEMIAMHPHVVPADVVSKIDGKLINKFSIFRSIVEGHATKSILRYYVVKSAGRYVQELLPLLSDECCQTIISYMNNESILKVCVAMTTQIVAEERLLVKL